jgi:Protein kinase domain
LAVRARPFRIREQEAMNPGREDWAALLALLDTALELDEPARQPWLQALPEPRRSQLRDLLASRGAIETQDFLARPAALPSPPGGAQPGQRVGPWRLLHELGSGGMAWVWLAERADGQGTRRVALKLPRLGWAPGLAERMARERDILATLEHPNIARLYDAGVDDQGRPWLALEHVQGQPIDEHARERALSVPERLQLLLQVCDAASYAHARQVIHRDIKPSNILVTAAGEVRLLDFGIAKLMRGDQAQSTQLTRASGRALTPDYASPEQVMGEPLSASSDVYSLGVVAYELLTGVRPYKLQRGSAVELEEAIAQARVETPSRLARSAQLKRALRGDLDAVLLKALKRRMQERYAGAQALAADIRHLLQHEPVLARPDSWLYRLRLRVRRHPLETALIVALLIAVPAGAAAQVAVMLALGAGATATLWQARRARAQARHAEHQTALAEQVKQLVLDTFRAADGDEGAHADTRAADLLRAAAQRLAERSELPPAVAAELRLALADSLVSLGLFSEAVPLAREALRLTQAQPSLAHTLRVDALNTLGDALLHDEQADEALACLQRAGAIPGDARRWVRTQAGLAAAFIALGRAAEGLPHAEAAARRASEEALAGRHALSQRDAMKAHAVHAMALQISSRPGLLAATRQVLACTEAVYGRHETRPVLMARLQAALAEVSEGDTARGLAELRQSTASVIRLQGLEHPQSAIIINWLAVAESDVGDIHAAIGTQRRGLELQVGLTGPHSETVGMQRMVLAHALLKGGWPERVVDELREAPRLAREVPLGWSTAVGLLAHAHASLGNLEQAQSLLDDVPAEHRRTGPMSWKLWQADLWARQGRHDDAWRCLDHVLPVFRSGAPLRAGPNLVSAARVALTCGRAQEALACVDQAHERLASRHVPDSPLIAALHGVRGECQLALGQTADAFVSFEHAAARWRLFDPAHPRAAQIESTLVAHRGAATGFAAPP